MKKVLVIGVIVAALVSLLAVSAVVAGGPPKGPKGPNGPAGKSNVAFLYLFEKDPSDWSIVEEGAWGKLKYNQKGPEFEYLFNGHGLAANATYSLIYYADFYDGDPDDRYSTWGGNYPGALIATGSSNEEGDVHLKGSIDLGMNLPDDEDGNKEDYDYSGPPDNYANAHGAKIWLVPSSMYDEDANKVTAWSPGEFLFETDLIWYEDTDD